MTNSAPDHAPEPPTDPATEPVTSRRSRPVPATCPPRPVAAPPAATAYDGGAWIARAAPTAADDSREHAERAERREIGQATLEQFRAEVTGLSQDSMTGEPLTLLAQIRPVRDRLHAALARRLWPRDQGEVYLLLGVLADLAAVAAAGLGDAPAARTLISAGWAYATAAGHQGLRAHLRLQAASICHWAGQPRRVADLAADGLGYQADGPTAAHLHLKCAQAAARLGDQAAARRAIIAAAQARERQPRDDVADLDGEFTLSAATWHYLAGSVLAELDGAVDEAARELDEAARGYAAGPGPGERHWFGAKALTDIDRTAIYLRAGDLDAAAVLLDPVLSLPRGQRITAVTIRLVRARRELAAPTYQGSAHARELGERIEQFCRETVVADLHNPPSG